MTACRPAARAALARRSVRRCALALAAQAAVPAALAQYNPAPPFYPAPRGYLSLGAGASSYGVSCGNSAQCDRVGNAVRAAAGLFVTPYAAFELAAADFGDSRIGTPYGESEFKVRMAGVGIALTMEYGARFNGLLRFGVAQVEATQQLLRGAPTPTSRRTSAEGYYGFTMGYMLTPNLAAELSFDGTRYDVGDDDVGRVDALTFGLSLRF